MSHCRPSSCACKKKKSNIFAVAEYFFALEDLINSIPKEKKVVQIKNAHFALVSSVHICNMIKTNFFITHNDATKLFAG